MKKIIVGLALWSSLAWAATKQTFNFDDVKAGTQPSGWSSGFYGKKGNPSWKVEKDSSAPSKPMVLRQTGRATYGWLVKDGPLIQNGSVEADLQVVSGKEDPEAGLVWRHLDGKNYYYVRVNAVEDNVIFYRMNKGNKEVVKVADTKVPFKTWHHLKVDFHGDQIEILLDGKSLISVRDNVFSQVGHVGFFTTADTISQFDNFSLVQD
jgi:hypothetical protein